MVSAIHRKRYTPHSWGGYNEYRARGSFCSTMKRQPGRAGRKEGCTERVRHRPTNRRGNGTNASATQQNVRTRKPHDPEEAVSVGGKTYKGRHRGKPILMKELNNEVAECNRRPRCRIEKVRDARHVTDYGQVGSVRQDALANARVAM